MSRLLTLLLIAAISALVVHVRLPKGPHYLYVLHKLGHPLAFGLMAWLIHTRARGTSGYAGTLLLTVLLGGATELAQAALGRDARWTDVGRDALGAAAALSLHAWWLARRGSRSAQAGRWRAPLAAALSLAVLAPLLWCAAAYANRAWKFPTVAQFDTPLDRYFLAANGARLETSDAPAGLRVVPDQQGTGLGLDEPTPDWSGYDLLVLDVSNPNDSTLTLLLRIHDRQHDWEHRDRYNGRFEVPPRSRQQLRVSLADIQASPESRQLDLHDIAGVALFVPRAAVPQPFVVSRLSLQVAGSPH